MFLNKKISIVTSDIKKTLIEIEIIVNSVIPSLVVEFKITNNGYFSILL
jgi:hypothetical protein